MSSSILAARLFRHLPTRRLGMGWMAVLASGIPSYRGHAVRAASSQESSHSVYHFVENLTASIRQKDSFRSPPTLLQEPVSKRQEGRLRTEMASEICKSYSALPSLKLPLSEDCERTRIIMFLSSTCSPQDETIQQSVQHWLDKGPGFINGRLRNAAITALRRASTPEYEDLLEFILKSNTIDGMNLLVSLREDITRVLRWLRISETGDERLSHVEDLDAYLLRILSLWFSPGMLELKRITYEDTPASVIEFIARNEAVHPLKSLDDLRTRLGPGRRVLALFHPLLGNRPLIFVHVALTQTIPSSMTEVMDLIPDGKASCATFYSITNAQPGLAGVGLGEHLLKESINSLKRELESLDTFVTLSPMPNFRKWLEEKIQQNYEKGHFYDQSLLSETELAHLVDAGILDAESPWTSLSQFLNTINLSPQARNPKQHAIIKPILSRLAARYIFLEKHRRKPLDGVARFHLGNGAIADRVNFGADLSRKGIQNSFGIMVNYRYDIKALEENQLAFEKTYHIQGSEGFLKLLS